MKNLETPAASMELLRVIAEFLDTDPELADACLFEFAKKWGKEFLQAFINYIIYAKMQELPAEMVKRTIEMDLSYSGDDPNQLITASYTDLIVGGLQ